MSKLFATLLVLASIGAAQAQTLRIQYAEPIELAPTAGRAQFDAYGRRFTLELENNDVILGKLPAARKAQLAGFHLWRGRLTGVAGSWVRLTETAGRYEGVIWDGQDLYSITQYARVADALSTPLDVAGDQTVTYRLGDSRGLLPPRFCGLDSSQASADRPPLEQYKSLVTELQTQAAAAAVIGDQMEISLIADDEYAMWQAGDPVPGMLSHFNIVQGIFAEQVGVVLVPTDIRQVGGAGNPLTATTSAALLTQLATYRSNTPAVRQRGLAHLITGKALEADVAGTGYIGVLCDATRGVSLSEGDRNGGLDGFASSLIMAHEIGHNFGAPHDGETGSACASTPQNFLMAPQYNGSATFSQCSLAQIAPVVAGARGKCVTPAQYADTDIAPIPTNLQFETGNDYVIPLQLRVQGTQAAPDATVVIDVDSLLIQSLSSAQGNCSIDGSRATCNIGNVPVGETRALTLTVRATTARDYILSVTSDAGNDPFKDNNERRVSLHVISGVDAGLTLQATPSTVFVGDPVQVVVDVSPKRSQPLVGSVVTIGMDGASATVINTNSGSCAVQNDGRVLCTLGTVAVGSTAHIVVDGVGAAAGPHRFNAGVVTPTDDNFDNNGAVQDYTVQAVRDATVSAPANYQATVGAPEEVQFAITAPGRDPVSDLYLEVVVPPNSLNVLALRIDGVDCPVPVQSWPRCPLASVTPGETHIVSLRFTAAFDQDVSISAQLVSPNDQGGLNNFATVQVVARYRIDARVEKPTVAPSGLDGKQSGGSLSIGSHGFDAARNVVLTLDVPPEVRLLGGAISASGNKWQCSLVTAQRLTCTIDSYGPNTFDSLGYQFVSDTVGSYTAHASIHGDGDTNPANDSTDFQLEIRPFEDASMSGLDGSDLLFALDETKEFPLTLHTGRDPVAGVLVHAPQLKPYLELVGMSSSGYDCTISDTQGECDFGDLPANSSIPVTVKYHAVSDAHGRNVLEVTAFATNEADWVNNHTFVYYEVGQPADLSLKLANSADINVAPGATFSYPQITITNTSATSTAYQPVFDFEIPSFTSVSTISAGGAVCSGTFVLRCNFPSLPPGGSIVIDVTLTANTTGSQIVTSHVMSQSDTNNDNDWGDVNLRVSDTPIVPPVTPPTPPPTPPPSTGGGSSGGSSGGGGGGGALEWQSLVALALLLAARQRRRTAPVGESYLRRPQQRCGLRH